MTVNPFPTLDISSPEAQANILARYQRENEELKRNIEQLTRDLGSIRNTHTNLVTENSKLRTQVTDQASQLAANGKSNALLWKLFKVDDPDEQVNLYARAKEIIDEAERKIANAVKLLAATEQLHENNKELSRIISEKQATIEAIRGHLEFNPALSDEMLVNGIANLVKTRERERNERAYLQNMCDVLTERENKAESLNNEHEEHEKQKKKCIDKVIDLQKTILGLARIMALVGNQIDVLSVARNRDESTAK